MNTNSNYFILVRYSQESRVQELVLDSSSFVIGRSSGSDVMIDEQGVSRQHLRVHFDGQSIEVEDLGSSNGTFFQGRKLVKGSRLLLSPGEKVKLGIEETYVWFELVTKELPHLPDEADHSGKKLTPSPLQPLVASVVSSMDPEKSVPRSPMKKIVIEEDDEDEDEEENIPAPQIDHLKDERQRLQQEVADLEKKVSRSRSEAELIIQDALRMQKEVTVDREKAVIEIQRERKNETERLTQELKQKRDSEFQEMRSKREAFEAELMAYEKQRLEEIKSMQSELDEKENQFEQKQDEFEESCRQRMIEIENIKKETQKQKEVMLIEAQEQVYLENQKYLTEVQNQIEQAQERRDEILHDAKKDAESIKQRAESESKMMLEKAKDTAAVIRKAAEDQSKIFRERKEKELNIAQQKVENEAKRMIESAEQRKQEIVKQAEIILQEATYEAEQRTAQTKGLFAKIEAEANAEKQSILSQFEAQMEEARNKFAEETKAYLTENERFNQLLTQLRRTQADLESQNSALNEERQKSEAEIQRLKQDHFKKLKVIDEFEVTSRKIKEEVASLETQRSNLLHEVSELQRKNELALAEAKTQGEQILANYEKSLDEKKSKEDQIIDKRRLELAMEFKSEEARMKKAFTEQSKQISKNLVKFLQIYHFEHKSFDFKNLDETQLKEFEDVFYNNLITETKADPSQQTHVVGEKVHFSRQTKQMVFLVGGFLMLALAVPQFLPSPYRQQFSLIDRMNPAAGADRYIASLKQDRDRRYAPEKVKFVFDNFRLNVMYGDGFVDKWKSDSFQKKWVRRMQDHFYTKYRISEEIMIQVASKEAALVESLGKVAGEIHPDFFKISFEKMQREEQETMEQIQRLLGSDVAFADYRHLAFDFYSQNH